jgi:Zn-dependent oligopeptidase
MKLRHKIARLLRYESWADYITEVRMAKNAKGVIDFLADLEAKLLPTGAKETKDLLLLKEEDCEKRELPFDGKINVWDSSYYERIHRENALGLDGELIKQYFPVPFVVRAVLEIYQSCLGVQFIEVPGDLWHAGSFRALHISFL